MPAIAHNLLGLGSMHVDMARDVRLKDKFENHEPTSKEPVSTSGKAQTDPGKKAEIRKISEEFESLFLGLVLKSMRDSIQKSGLIDGGNAENIYRSMLDEEYAKQMAAQHHTGLADQIADFLNGQNETKGQKAYTAQGLPDAAKQATIGVEHVKPAALAPTIFSPPDSSHDVTKSKTP